MSGTPPRPVLGPRRGHPHGRALLDRRTVLRGVGAALALPWLQAFAPRPAAAGEDAPIRLAFLFAPNGVNPAAWFPAREGPAFDLPPSLQPLEPVREHVLIAGGLDQDAARAHGDGPGDHARSAAVFLTSAHPVKTAGEGLAVGASIDQVAARALGRRTRVPSLEMGLEAGGRSGSCDSGYACAYTNHVSWSDPSTPNPKEVDPRRIFERLFGAPDARPAAAAGVTRRSVLDRVADELRELDARLGRDDRETVGAYLESVRETERRIEQAERHDRDVLERLGERRAPTGVPRRHADHSRLLLELLVLAFETDATRIVTHMLGNGGSNRVYTSLGVTEGHHSLSHHAGDAAKIAQIQRIDRWFIEEFAWLVQRLGEVREGEATLLDRTALVMGSGIRDGNRHDHGDLPILVAGRAGGALHPGRAARWPQGTPLANLFLTLLDAAGVGAGIERFGDSTGRLQGA